MFPLRFRTAVNFQLWNSTEIILSWSHQTEELHWRVTASRRLRVTALRGEMIGLRCSKGLGWSRKSKRSPCSDFGSSSLSTDRIQFDWPCPNALHEWILPMTLLVFLVLFSLQLTVWLIYSCTEPEVIMSAILKKSLVPFYQTLLVPVSILPYLSWGFSPRVTNLWSMQKRHKSLPDSLADLQALSDAQMKPHLPPFWCLWTLAFHKVSGKVLTEGRSAKLSTREALRRKASFLCRVGSQAQGKLPIHDCSGWISPICSKSRWCPALSILLILAW